jgi:hypothetical protein
MPTPPNVGDQVTATQGALALRVPITFKDAGIATSGAVNILTTALRTVTNPYGTGVAYRVKSTYQLGFISAAAGITCRAGVNVNGSTASFCTVNSLAGATPNVEVDMASGGTVTFQGVITNLTGTVATFVDGTSHFLLTEIFPL